MQQLQDSTTFPIWNSSSTYSATTNVQHKGIYYIANCENIGVEPGVDYWDYVDTEPWKKT